MNRHLETIAYLAVLQRPLTTAGLATLLGVSPASAARTLASMRRQGVDLVSVRSNGAWHYEIRDAAERARRQWTRLRRAAGFARRWKPMPGRAEDEIIYG